MQGYNLLPNQLGQRSNRDSVVKDQNEHKSAEEERIERSCLCGAVVQQTTGATNYSISSAGDSVTNTDVTIGINRTGRYN